MHIKIRQVSSLWREDFPVMLHCGTWYIWDNKRDSYLHHNLKWHMEAKHKGKYTGWYKSRREARETLTAWYDKVTKIED